MKNKEGKRGCWGCFGMICVAVGISELIFAVATFNIGLFIFAILSTIAIGVTIGGKLQEIDQEEETDDTEVIQKGNGEIQ